MIKAKKIDHVCLWVRSLSEAKDYYGKVFNFECRYRENEQNTLIVESDKVHFFLSEEKMEILFLSKQHISFTVESISEVVDNLSKLGITDYTVGKVDCFKRHNYKWCEWRDPSGIRLECVEMV